MPVPIPEALAAHEAAAAVKARQARSSPLKYLGNSALAGAYVGVAVILLIMASGAFVAAKAPSAKLVQGAVFGVALTLVVFAGAELFTGNVMVMLQGISKRTIGAADLAFVWAGSLLGNLIGSLGFAALVNASGVLSTGATPGQKTPTAFQAALGAITQAKSQLTFGQLFFRSVLCNMLVCLGLWMAARAASDSAKLICLFWALLAFVASGFEHSIANMTIFGLGIFSHAPGATAAEMTRNLMATVPGNIVGGGALVGLAYSWIGRDTTVPETNIPGEPELVLQLDASADAVVTAKA